MLKKYLFLPFLLGALIVPLSVGAQSDIDTSGDTDCAVLNTNLKYGMRDTNANGNSVSILQDFLHSRGYLASEPTGFFGSMTRAAAAAFQRDNGIAATPAGFVGPTTRAQIKAIDCGTYVPTAGTSQTFPATVSPATQSGLRITVMSPNGGETLKRESKHNIWWSSILCNPDCGDAPVYYYDIHLVESNTCNSSEYACIQGFRSYVVTEKLYGTSFDWTVGRVKADTAPDGSYKIMVCQSGTQNCDTSDSSFRIASSPDPLARVTVLSPNGGEEFEAKERTAHAITWSYPAISSAYPIDIRISYLDAASGERREVDITERDVPNSGRYDWAIPLNFTEGKVPNQFKVRVINSDHNMWDYSDNTFTITSESFDPLARVTVLSPNGGETWRTGNTYEIQWSYPTKTLSANPIDIRISYRDAVSGEFKEVDLFAPDIANSGSYMWTIPENFAEGKWADYFKVRIINSDHNMWDYSDEYFHIVPADFMGLNSPGSSLVASVEMTNLYESAKALLEAFLKIAK